MWGGLEEFDRPDMVAERQQGAHHVTRLRLAVGALDRLVRHQRRLAAMAALDQRAQMRGETHPGPAVTLEFSIRMVPWCSIVAMKTIFVVGDNACVLAEGCIYFAPHVHAIEEEIEVPMVLNLEDFSWRLKAWSLGKISTLERYFCFCIYVYTCVWILGKR